MKTADDESDTDTTLLTSLLQIENEYEKPIDPNFYRKNDRSFLLENSTCSQIHTNYTPQVIQNS